MLAPFATALSLATASSHRAMHATLAQARSETTTLAATLRALSPQSTLERGFAVVRTPDGAVVSDATSISKGDVLRIRLARGEVEAVARGRAPKRA
jgi:exodeoxyribonuclease VII large subunit